MNTPFSERNGRGDGSDDRGGTDAMRVVGLVVALTVGGLMASFLLPIGIDALNGDDAVTLDQQVSDGFDSVGSGIEADLTSTDATNSTASYNVTYDGDYQSVTVSEGSSSTVTVGGEDVTVSPQSISTGSATTEYTFSSTIGWSSGAVALWGILDVILVLAVFLFFIGVALAASRRT